MQIVAHCSSYRLAVVASGEHGIPPRGSACDAAAIDQSLLPSTNQFSLQSTRAADSRKAKAFFRHQISRFFDASRLPIERPIAGHCGTLVGVMPALAAFPGRQLRFWIDEVLWSQGRVAVELFEQAAVRIGAVRTGGPTRQQLHEGMMAGNANAGFVYCPVIS